jgi:hypothetical protein
VKGGVQIYASEDDLDQCLYYLRTLSNMLRWSSDGMWAALAQNSISTDSSHQSLYRISKLAIPEYTCTSDILSWP